MEWQCDPELVACVDEVLYNSSTFIFQSFPRTEIWLFFFSAPPPTRTEMCLFFVCTFSRTEMCLFCFLCFFVFAVPKCVRSNTFADQQLTCLSHIVMLEVLQKPIKFKE